MKKIFSEHSDIRRRIWLIAGIVLAAACLLLAVRLIINACFVSSYKKGVYHYTTEKAALYLAPADNYVLYYNLGNAGYKKGDYKEAILEYSRALAYDIPAGKECAIRVNLALARTGTIDFDTINKEYAEYTQGKKVDEKALVKEISDALSELNNDREILTEKGCADENDANGHSPEAEALKADIDAEIKKLQEMLDKLGSQSEESKDDSKEDNKQDSTQNDTSDDKTSASREKEVQEKMEEHQQEALEERSETQKKYEEAQGAEAQGTGSQGTQGSDSSDKKFDGKTW